MSKHDEAIELLIEFLNREFRLFDPKTDTVKFVPPRSLELGKKFLEEKLK